MGSIALNMSTNRARSYLERIKIFLSIFLSMVSIKNGLHRLPHLHLWPATKYQEALCLVKSSYINIMGKNTFFFFLVKTTEKICREGNLSPAIDITIHINSHWWDIVKPIDSVLVLVFLGNKWTVQLFVWGKSTLN